jgi:hypothetical protein
MKRKTDSYSVGYRKPPKEKQFKKGQSGNPKGRPKKVVKSEGFYKLVIDELDSLVTIPDQGKNLRLSKRALIVKQIVNRAAKGERWALNALLSLLNFSQNDDGRVGVQFVVGDPEIVLEKYRKERAAEAAHYKSASHNSLTIGAP